MSSSTIQNARHGEGGIPDMGYRIDELPQKLIDRMATEDRAALGLEISCPKHNILGEADIQAEKDLLKLCEGYLGQCEIEYLHLSFRAREKAGWPDLTFALHGVPYAVELKSATGKLSAEQERLLSRLQANGWQVRVIRSFGEFHRLINGREAA